MKFIDAKNAFGFAPVIRGQNKLEVMASGDDNQIVLIGQIGASYWDDSGITEKDFRNALDSIPRKKVRLKLNSEGGSIQEGLGIYNAIKERSADITCEITGYAMSIASIIPLGASKVISPKSAVWMIHKAWNVSQGNADEMRKCAEMLDVHDETMAEIYAEHTGKSKAVMLAAMKAETWIRGSQAVDYGLADETSEDDSQASYRPINPEYLKKCKNISPEILNMISAPMQGAGSKPKENDTMNKDQIVALLKKHGVEASNAETLEQLQAKLDALPIAKNTEPKTEPFEEPTAVNRISAMEAKLKASEKARIKARLAGYVTAQKITNEELPIWHAAVAGAEDEETVFAILDKKEAAIPGGDPIGGNRIEILGGIDSTEDKPSQMLVNLRNEHKTPKARSQALKDCWPQILADATRRDGKGKAFAANTYSGTLVTSFLMDGSLTNLQNMWAALAAFSRDSSVDPYKPLATGVLKHVTGGATTQTNATNFESGNSVVAPISVTMNQYTQSFQVSNSDLNNGLRMQDLVTINSALFADKVIQVAQVPITAANFTAQPVITAPAAFGFSDLATLWGQLKKSPIKNVILDGEYMARIINTPTLFQATPVTGGGGFANVIGWDKVLLSTNWTTAGANVRGLACNPQALVGITGLPLTPPNIPGGILQMSTMQIPGLDIAIAVFQWFNPGTRTMWCSYDIVAGFSAGDTTAGVLIASGTPT